MKKMWSYVFVVIFLVLLLFVYFKLRCLRYSCISFADKEKYTVEEIYEDSSKRYRSQLSYKDIRLRIEAYANITSNEAQQFNLIKIMNLESLYITSKSSYPGALSNEIECGDEFKPHINTLSKTPPKTHIRGYLNDRFQFGSCIADEIRYESNMVLLYCKTHKKWYQIEIISSLNGGGNKREIVDSITCAESR